MKAKRGFGGISIHFNGNIDLAYELTNELCDTN